MTTNRLPIKLTFDKEDLDDDCPIEFIKKINHTGRQIK